MRKIKRTLSLAFILLIIALLSTSVYADSKSDVKNAINSAIKGCGGKNQKLSDLGAKKLTCGKAFGSIIVTYYSKLGDNPKFKSMAAKDRLSYSQKSGVALITKYGAAGTTANDLAKIVADWFGVKLSVPWFWYILLTLLAIGLAVWGFANGRYRLKSRTRQFKWEADRLRRAQEKLVKAHGPKAGVPAFDTIEKLEATLKDSRDDNALDNVLTDFSKVIVKDLPARAVGGMDIPTIYTHYILEMDDVKGIKSKTEFINETSKMLIERERKTASAAKADPALSALFSSQPGAFTEEEKNKLKGDFPHWIFQMEKQAKSIHEIIRHFDILRNITSKKKIPRNFDPVKEMTGIVRMMRENIDLGKETSAREMEKKWCDEILKQIASKKTSASVTVTGGPPKNPP